MDRTIRENDLLNTAFNDEKVIGANLRTLKRYYLACTEIRETDVLNTRVKEGLPKRKEFIRDMIEVHLRNREVRVATYSMVAAVIFSICTLAIAIRQEFRASTQTPATLDGQELNQRMESIESKLDSLVTKNNEKN